MTPIVPLKRAAQVSVSNVDKKADEGEVSVRLCNYVDVYYNDKIVDSLEFMVATATPKQIKTFGLRRGDVLFTKDSETPDDIAVPALVTENLPSVVCGYHLAIARPLKDVTNGRFLYWALTAQPTRDQFTVFATGVTRYGLRQDEIGRVEIPLPTLREQIAIADYLDEETARIDALMAKKVQLVSALSSRRQAVINDRVESASLSQLMMGQNSSNKIEPPSGWSVSRLDREATVHARIGWKALTASEYVDQGYAFLSTTNLRGDSIDFENVNFISEFRWLESPELQLQEGDVLMTKDGAGIGWTAVVRSVPRPSTVNGSIAVIRPKRIDGRFLFYVLSSDAIQELVGVFKSGMGVPHLFQADLKKFLLLKPSFAEQVEIAEFLDRETSRTDAAIMANARSISLLKERRQALITSAVNGQLDIPEAAHGNH